MEKRNPLEPPFMFGSQELDWPLMNAAGSINGSEEQPVRREVQDLVNTGIGAIKLGSVTIHECLGSEKIYGPHGWYIDQEAGEMFNNMKLPNPGKRVVKEWITKDLVKRVHDRGKPFIISVSPTEGRGLGSSTDQVVDLVREFIATEVDRIEINAGCPHIDKKDRTHAAPLGHDVEAMEELYDKLDDEFGVSGKLDMKVPTYLSPEDGKKFNFDLPDYIDQTTESKIHHIANFMKPKKVIGSVIACNTIPLQLPLDKNGEPIFAHIPGHRASLSGWSERVKIVGREQTAKWVKELEGRVEVVSSLGVDSGKEMAHRLQLGAVAVEGVSFLWRTSNWGEAVETVLKEFQKELATSQQVN